MYIPGDVIDGRLMVMEPINIENCVYSVLDFQDNLSLHEREIFCIRSDKEYFNLEENDDLLNIDDEIFLFKYVCWIHNTKVEFKKVSKKTVVARTARITQLVNDTVLIAIRDNNQRAYYFDCELEETFNKISLEVNNKKSLYKRKDIIKLTMKLEDKIIAKFLYSCIHVDEKKELTRILFKPLFKEYFLRECDYL